MLADSPPAMTAAIIIVAITIMVICCCVALSPSGVNGESSAMFAMIATNANLPMELYPFIINPLTGDAKQLSVQ